MHERNLNWDESASGERPSAGGANASLNLVCDSWGGFYGRILAAFIMIGDGGCKCIRAAECMCVCLYVW